MLELLSFNKRRTVWCFVRDAEKVENGIFSVFLTKSGQCPPHSVNQMNQKNHWFKLDCPTKLAESKFPQKTIL